MASRVGPREPVETSQASEEISVDISPASQVIPVDDSSVTQVVPVDISPASPDIHADISTASQVIAVDGSPSSPVIPVDIISNPEEDVKGRPGDILQKIEAEIHPEIPPPAAEEIDSEHVNIDDVERLPILERQIKGRPRHPFKDLYFEQQGEKSNRTNRYNCKCNFCDEVFDGRGELLEKHIIVKCLQVSDPIREQAARIVADRAPKDGDPLKTPKKAKKRLAGDADGHYEDRKTSGIKVPRGPRSGKRERLLALEAAPLGADHPLHWTEAEQLRRMVACHVAPGGEGAAARHAADIPLCQLAAEPYPWPSSGDLRPQTTVLLVLDMQKDFCCPGGYAEQLGTNITLARDIIPPIQSVLDTCRRLGFRVIFTREAYRKDLSNCPTPRHWRTNRMGAGIGSPGSMGRFLIEGEEGCDIIPEVYPSANDVVISKSSRGAFYSTDLDLMLRRWGITNLLLTGVSADVCVLSTMHQADDRGYDCVVLEDCCGGTDVANKAGALNSVKAEGGVFGAVSNSNSFLEALSGIETAEPWVC